MIVGNIDRFAIESSVSRFVPAISVLAIGNFTVHVAGKKFGRPAVDATGLGVPLDSMRRRIEQRGLHCAPFANVTRFDLLVRELAAAVYDGATPQVVTGLDAAEVASILDDNNIEWASDGDEAFDDGSHIYQFDMDDSVRVIACKSSDFSYIAETTLPSDEFYEILSTWVSKFESELRGAHS